MSSWWGPDGKHAKRNGKCLWIQPYYTKYFEHKVPGKNKKLRCQGGTQIIDRFWSKARGFLKARTGKVGSAALRERIRSAQWDHWHKDEDLWAKTGEMLSDLAK